MDSVKVSVIMPCYNQGLYLAEALDSVVNQTYEKWECIIINDGSTDNTEDIAHYYCSKDQRIKYIFQENKGVVEARNVAIRNSAGSIILPLDADDKISSTYMEKAVIILQSDSNCKIVYSKVWRFGEREEIFNLPPYSKYGMLCYNCIPSFSFFRRQDFEAIGGYNPKFKKGYEDWDLWLSLLESGGHVCQIKEVLCYYRVSVESRNASAMERTECLRNLLLESHPDYYFRCYSELLAFASSPWFHFYLFTHRMKEELHKIFFWLIPLFRSVMNKLK